MKNSNQAAASRALGDILQDALRFQTYCMYKTTLKTLPSLLLDPTVDNKTEETHIKSTPDVVLVEFSEKVPF